LIAICLGPGITVFPCIFYENGVWLGTLYIILGGLTNYYTGNILAYCASITGGLSFEEIAFRLFGKKGM